MTTNQIHPPNREPSDVLHKPSTRRRRRWRRGCLWMLLGGVLALLLPVSLAGISILAYLLFPPGARDILILGLDARQSSQYEALTDSIMVMGVQPGNLNVSLLSIPRDLYIDVPDYGLQRINTINVLGEQDENWTGPGLAQAAINTSFGIETEHYIRINFETFIAFIDALGGIDIEVPSRLIDYQYPTPNYGTTTVTFEPGWQHMNGERALAYARTRHADDDYRRAERQQQVLMAVMKAAIKPTNWPRLPDTLGTFLRSVDTDMTLGDLLLIAPPLIIDGASGNIDRLVIDRESIGATIDGKAVPRYQAINPWLEPRFD